MAKKTASKKKAASRKKAAASRRGLAGSVKARAGALIDEVEKASDGGCDEVRSGIGVGSDRAASTARSVTDSAAS